MKATSASIFLQSAFALAAGALLFFSPMTVPAQQMPDSRLTQAFFDTIAMHETNRASQLLESNTNLARVTYGLSKLPLLEAAAMGNVPLVKRLLELGADINAEGDTLNSGNARMTALDEAAQHGQLAVCKVLLAAGANPNHRAFQQTTLHFAFDNFRVTTNRNEIAKLLLEHGANPFAEAGYYKTTPIELDITKSDGTLIPLMLDQYRLPTTPPAHGAASLTRGTLRPLNATAEQFLAAHGEALLSAAVQRGELEAVQALLDAGVSARSNAPNGYPLLEAFALSAAQAAKARPAAIAQWQQTSNELQSFGPHANPEFVASIRSREAEQAAKVRALSPERWLQVRNLLIRYGADYDAFAATALGDTNRAERLLSADKQVVLARDHAGETPLHWAVKTDQLPLTAFWIRAGVPLAATNSAGQTALHLAAAKGLADQVQLLLAANAPTGIRDTNGLTPLDAAIQAKQSACIHLLMAKAPAAAHPGRGLTTTLHEAAADGNVAALAALLETQTNLEVRNELGLTPLQVAVLHGHLAAAALLVDKGANVNVRDPAGNTLLHQILLQDQLFIYDRPPTNWLARVGQDPSKQLYLKYLTVGRYEQGPNPVLQAASFLLASGADATATNHAGETPMQLITDEKTGRGVFFFDNDRTELLQLLGEHGGNVNARDADGNTALHRLCSGFYDISKVDRMASLIASGANVNATNNLGQTPLHLAAQHVAMWDNNNPPVSAPFQLLIYSKANVNAQDNRGLTPLDVVALSDSSFRAEATRALLDAGANPNLPDKQGRTPIDFFLSGDFGHWAGSDDCIDMLVKAGASLFVKDDQGKTPLHYLAALGSSGSMFFFPKLANDLLAAKVNLNARDNAGDTPLHIAARTGTHDVFDWLVQHGADLNATNNAGETPRRLAMRSTDRPSFFQFNPATDIAMAVIRGRLGDVAAILKAEPALLNKPTHLGRTPLRLAVETRRTNIVDFLDKQGAQWDPVSAILAERTNVLRHLIARQPRLAADGSLLRLAAGNGDLSAVKILLAAGADLKATDAFGLSALGEALARRHQEVARLLLKHGAAENIFDAAFSGDAQTAAALIRRDKSLAFATNALGVSVAEIAAATGDARTLKLLLDRGISSNYQNPLTGQSLLYAAAAYNQTNTAELLVQRRARLNAVDDLGLTPLQVSALRGSAGVLALLLKHKAGVNVRVAPAKTPVPLSLGMRISPVRNRQMLEGNTALHLAALTAQTNAITLLLKWGASVNATNANGKTPLDLAGEFGPPPITLMRRTGLKLPPGGPYSIRDNPNGRRSAAIALLTQAGGKHGERRGPNGTMRFGPGARIPIVSPNATQVRQMPILQTGADYHNQGCLDYDAHRFTNALADFRKSCELGSKLQDYSYFRIWLIRARLGQEKAATRELSAYLKKRKAPAGNDWPLKVGLFLTGQLSESDFLKAADNSHPQTEREQQCEAYFYAGSKRLIENDKAAAVNDFKKCLATGQNNFEEYASAQAELRFLRVPFIPIQTAAPH